MQGSARNIAIFVFVQHDCSDGDTRPFDDRFTEEDVWVADDCPWLCLLPNHAVPPIPYRMMSKV